MMGLGQDVVAGHVGRAQVARGLRRVAGYSRDILAVAGGSLGGYWRSESSKMVNIKKELIKSQIGFVKVQIYSV